MGFSAVNKGFLKFQAEAASRFMDNMIKNHKCGTNRLVYNTNAPATCGLTMEEMVATCYWASKDVNNFKPNILKDTHVLHPIIAQLHDMQRGYDIDWDTDKPGAFPVKPGPDNNRCHGGCVNSLPSALSTIHKAYQMKIVQRKDLEREIKIIYEDIVSNEIDSISSCDKEILRKWSTTGKITGKLRGRLEGIFLKEHYDAFKKLYKDYIDGSIFKDVVNNALDNIAMPTEALKSKWSIESMTQEDVYIAIKNDRLPILHLDKDRGYISTLQYLGGLKGKEDLIYYVISEAFEEKITYEKKAILYLSRSKFDGYKDLIVVLAGKEFSLDEISSLSEYALTSLEWCTGYEQILKLSIERGIEELFALYALKFGFTESSLRKSYGQIGSVMHYAAWVGQAEILKLILEKHPQQAKALLNGNNAVGNTPLHLAAKGKNLGAVRVILETEEGRGSLSVYNNKQETPLYLAAYYGYYEIVKEILNSKEGKAAFKLCDQNGHTILGMAIMLGDARMVDAIVKCYPESLQIKDGNDLLPLEYAIRLDASP